MAKLKPAEQAQVRKAFYELVEVGLDGLDFEPISTGILAHAEDGTMVEIRVIVKDEEKFNLAEERQAYADKQKNAAERAEKSAKIAAEKAAKAKAKAEKAQAKATDTPAE